jgi:hypothetical protein
MKTSKALPAAVLGLAFSLPAAAVPVHATFDGIVSGTGSFADVLSTFPIGTAASFDVTFDDAGLGPTAPVTDLDAAPVFGTVRLGAEEWTLDAGQIVQYSYSLDPGNPILWYQLQLTGSGPLIDGNASLFGLFLTLTPSLAAAFASSFSVGFGFPVGEYATFYSYADLSGDFAATRSTSVPEPGTAFLMLPALALLFRLRRSGAGKQAPLADKASHPCA